MVGFSLLLEVTVLGPLGEYGFKPLIPESPPPVLTLFRELLLWSCYDQLLQKLCGS